MGNQKVREKKKPTFFLAVLPILAMILLLGSGGSHCYRIGIYMG